MSDNPTVTLSVGPSPDESPHSLVPLLIFLSVVLLLVGGFFLTILLGSKTSYKNAPITYTASPSPSRVATTVSGTVYFEGYIPAGSYISIAERGEGKGQFKEVVTGLTPTNGQVTWSWTDATNGSNYDMEALLKVQGKAIQQSPIVAISAPATSVALMLVSQQIPPAPVPAKISGQINLDGYAPAGSTLQVLVKTVGAVAFQSVAASISAVDNASWSWSGAVSGTTYLVKAQLVDKNNAVISTGDTQTIIAPSSGELLNVASTAKPSALSPVGISGNIIINGAVPSGAYITLATRLSGAVAFNQVASNIAATSGVGFSWGNATADKQYDVQAYLWVGGKPYAASNILSVTAPSTFDVLTINAQQSLQAPSNSTINVSCGGQQNNQFQATINYNTSANLSNAKAYNIVVTLASQNSQVVNTTVNPPNPTQSQSLTTTFILQSGATYYAQYAYSTDGANFSALSGSIQFACK